MSGFRCSVFREPPSRHCPALFWFLNDRLDLRMLLRQLRDMAAHGARSVCLHPLPREFRPTTMPSAMAPPYLSPAYFRVIRRIVAECETLGLNYWLYDEGGWPSGGACGQVMKLDPTGYARATVVAGSQGPEVRREVSPQPGPAPYPNLLTPGVTEAFLRLTHEGYRRAVGDHFGRTIRWVFTDEPAMPATLPGRCLTWTDDFGEVFRRQHGYALEPHLADLLRWPPPSRAVQEIHVDFHDTCSRLFLERYLLPVRRWCRQHRLLSGGHLNGEDEPRGNADYGYGHILRALRAMDLPGVDVIWRQLFPGGRRHVFPKYASSAAHQTGRRFVAAEIFAVYGNGLQPRQMKWLVDYLLVRGINTFVLSNYAQTRRDHAMAGCRPHLGPVDPLWKYADILYGSIARLGAMLSQGEPVVPTAFYYDIRAIWAGGADRDAAIAWHDRLAEGLLERQRDFDVIDDDQLAGARIEGRRLRIGRQSYEAVVMPPSSWVTSAARATLDAWTAAGGRVLGPDDLSAAPALLAVDPPCPGLRVCKRRLGDQALYFVTHEEDTPTRVRLTLAEDGPVVFCRPSDGALCAVPSSRGAFTWDFEPWGSALFLSGGEADHDLPTPAEGPTLPLDGPWTLQPLRRHRPGAHTYEVVPLKTPPAPAALGDWREALGEDFSGDARYAIEFDSPHAGAATLDLGEVRYACAVTLNGRRVGREFFGPFRFEVRLRRGRYRLAVTVTNTLANAIAPAAVEAHWAADCPPVSPYESRQRAFERDSLSSGLLGPVRLILRRA